MPHGAFHVSVLQKCCREKKWMIKLIEDDMHGG